MASELRVDKIIPSSGTSIGIGTASGTIDILGNSQINTTGVITASSFSGSGANLTNIPSANLTGTIADARFPATLPAASAANLTNVPAANITGTLPAISGANLTGIGGWTHVNYLSLSGGSYTFSSIPTDTSQLIFYFGGVSSNTGSSGSESYPAIRLGTSGGLKTDNYVTVTGYLETSYHYVSAWTSRAILIRENYGRAENAFTGFMTCWKAPNTNKWYMNCVMNRGASTATDFRTSSFIDLGASITQAQLFLNTGSFDAGSVALSYYQD